MKRSACALGLVLMALWVAGDSIGAQETAEENPPAEEAPPSPPAIPAAGTPSAGERTGLPKVFAELLFVKPTLDDTFFVISSPASSAPPNGPTGSRVNNDFDFEPAFRIGAGYEVAESGHAVELSYTRLDADASKTVLGSFLWATRGSPHFGASFEDYAGSATAELDLIYQQIDAHLVQPWRVANAEIAIRFGFEWADFRVGEEYVYADATTGAVGRLSAASRSWGIGPDLGLALDYQLCHKCVIPGAFSVHAGSTVGLLLSETNTRGSSVRLGVPLLSVRDEETSRVLPAIHARVGLDYAVALSDRIGGTFGVGYQIDSYLRALTRSSFVDDIARGESSTDYYDFDLQGIFAAVGMVF